LDEIADALHAALDRCRPLLLEPGATVSWLKTGSHGRQELVTEADHAVEKILIGAIRGIDPEIAIVAEETLNDTVALKQQRCFVIDPIDGTKEFVEGRDGFSISVALLEARRPVFAIVDFPARRQRFVARSGFGVSLNGHPLKLSARPAGKPLKVAVSPKQFADSRFRRVQSDTDRITFVPTGALVSKVAGVATGMYDAAFSFGWEGSSAPVWDFAGAGLVLQEAGGFFSSLDGSPLLEAMEAVHSDGWLAASASCHRRVCDWISSSLGKNTKLGGL
jgi:myo-inositol-1(or 4)-monophosphatase